MMADQDDVPRRTFAFIADGKELHSEHEEFITRNDGTLRRFVELVREGKNCTYVCRFNCEDRQDAFINVYRCDDAYVMQWQCVEGESGVAWGGHNLCLEDKHLYPYVAKYAGVVEFFAEMTVQRIDGFLNVLNAVNEVFGRKGGVESAESDSSDGVDKPAEDSLLV